MKYNKSLYQIRIPKSALESTFSWTSVYKILKTLSYAFIMIHRGMQVEQSIILTATIRKRFKNKAVVAERMVIIL